MKALTPSSQETLNRLKEKAEVNSDVRFPSIQSIHNLLTELGIEHYFDGETQNTVEYRSGRNSYVNSRHDGKKGKKVTVRAYVIDENDYCLGRGYNDAPKKTEWLSMDSSESYHSYNTWGYSLKLVTFIENQDRLRFEQK